MVYPKIPNKEVQRSNLNNVLTLATQIQLIIRKGVALDQYHHVPD